MVLYLLMCVIHTTHFMQSFSAEIEETEAGKTKDGFENQVSNNHLPPKPHNRCRPLDDSFNCLSSHGSSIQPNTLQEIVTLDAQESIGISNYKQTSKFIRGRLLWATHCETEHIITHGILSINVMRVRMSLLNLTFPVVHSNTFTSMWTQTGLWTVGF